MRGSHIVDVTVYIGHVPHVFALHMAVVGVTDSSIHSIVSSSILQECEIMQSLMYYTLSETPSSPCPRQGYRVNVTFFTICDRTTQAYTFTGLNFRRWLLICENHESVTLRKLKHIRYYYDGILDVSFCNNLKESLQGPKNSHQLNLIDS